MAAMVVCPTCEGRGKITNPAIDGNGLTAEDFAELGDEFREDYFSGLYDIACPRCHGRNVVPGCAIPGCSGPRAFYDDTESGSYFTHREQMTHCWDHLDADERESVRSWSETAAMSAAERRMGA